LKRFLVTFHFCVQKNWFYEILLMMLWKIS